jgi:serine protease Do
VNAGQQGKSRIGWLVATLVLLTFVLLGVPSRMLTQWTYAVERGRLQADSEELAALNDNLAGVQEVSHAFRLVAKVARPGVVHIRVSRDEQAHERIVELNREREELTLELENARRRAEGDSEEQPTAGELIRIFQRLRQIADELEVLAERISPGTGSGIIFDEQGHILTNSHVVADRTEIRVTLPDEREYEARLIGSDPKTDLAVIKIVSRPGETPTLHPLKFGDSEQAEVGDWVIAVGAPFGLSQSVTHGIISATGRNNVVLGRGILYRNFLQTDAAINPGNSGGPLLNLRGEVIGVNTAIATNGDSYNAGIAFTIPSNMAVKIANQLKETGVVARGWLGISLSELTKADNELFGLQGRHGVMVDVVFKDSPAQRAGLLCEDVVLEVNGAETTGIRSLQAIIADILPGETARLTLLRDRHEEAIEVRLGQQPDDLRSVPGRGGAIVGREFKPLALHVRSFREGLPVTLALQGEYRDLARLAFEHGDKHGVLVVEPSTSGGRRSVDLHPGDLIVSVNQRSVGSFADLAEAFQPGSYHKTIEFSVVNPEGEYRTVTYRPK